MLDAHKDFHYFVLPHRKYVLCLLAMGLVTFPEEEKKQLATTTWSATSHDQWENTHARILGTFVPKGSSGTKTLPGGFCPGKLTLGKISFEIAGKNVSQGFKPQDRIFPVFLRKAQFYQSSKNVCQKFLRRFAPNVLFILPNPEGTGFCPRFFKLSDIIFVVFYFIVFIHVCFNPTSSLFSLDPG